MTLRMIKAGLAYFALMFGIGFVLGVLRVFLLVPRVGERIAELAEMPLMFAVILVAALYVARKFALPLSVSVRLGMGFLALGLLLAAELLLAVTFQNRSLADYIGPARKAAPAGEFRRWAFIAASFIAPHQCRRSSPCYRT